MMLLMLLIGVVIMVFLMTKSITSLRSGVTGTDISNQDPGGGLAPINAAKNAKNLIEQDNARAIQQLK